MRIDLDLEKETPHMIIEFVILGALAAAAVVGAIVVTIRDGYRREPSRRA